MPLGGASSFAPRVQKVGVVGKRPWPKLGLLSSLLLQEPVINRDPARGKADVSNDTEGFLIFGIS